MSTMKLPAALAAAVALAALVLTTCGGGSSAMSIDKEPVKVTHSNSGPRYDIARDEVERTRIHEHPEPARRDEQPEQPERPESAELPTPIGHLSIRRVFLVPVRPAPDEWPAYPRHSEMAPEELQRHSLGNPLAAHLFGADQASRSPGAGPDEQPAASGEREAHQPAARPMLDPIQMMVDLMHQALSGQLLPPPPPPPPPAQANTDLNREASAPRDQDPPRAQDERDLQAPPRPQSKNETREDVVEIDGKKYLRKTIINRHVGENIIFMTKRLIFVPLNETDSTETLTTTTTTTAAAAAAAAAADVTGAPSTDSISGKADEATELPSRPSTPAAADEPTTTTTVASAPTTTSETTQTDKPTEAPLEPSSSTPAASEQPEATTTTTTTSEPATRNS